MANEFVARNGIIALNNTTISGSLSVTNSVSGSIFTGSFIGDLIGTSSQALTASYIQASGVVGLNLSQIATGSVTASVNINSGSFSVTSGSSNFFFISSSGNVGIGTSNPSGSFQVNASNYNTATSTSLYITDHGNNVNDGNEAARIQFQSRYWGSDDTVTSVQSAIAHGKAGNNGQGGSFLAFHTTTRNAGNILERMRISSDGVGIGLVSASARLHVSGTSGALLQTTSGSTTGLFVSSSGFVGIGTTFPSESLHVNGIIGADGTDAAFVYRSRNTSATGAPTQFSIQHNSGNVAINNARGAIYFTPNVGFTSGSVGIGKTSANTRLDVNGNTLISGSLTVTGSIIAQTLIVQTVSSSIIYSSGSNIFGDASNDNQIFTGSVLISGSITVSGSVTNNLTASYALNADTLDGTHLSQLATTGSNIFRGNQSITGSLIVSSSTFATAIIGSGSGVFTVDGTSGRLFSVDDSLSGSLFSVNTAAGLPVIEAFSDNTVRIGQFGKRALFVSQSRVGFGKETSLNGDIDVSGSVVITGSLSVSGSVVNNLTSSFAISASYANNFDAGYAKTFSQLTPAVTWSIIHDLNSLVPLIQVYDLSYSQIIPSSIVNTSRSGSSITFATSQSGYVVISTGGITVTGSNAILSQTTPSATWSFAHNLNTQFPVFTVFDSSNNVIMPLQINATNANSASIYFSSPQIGTAVAANGGVGAAASNNATASFTNSSTWTFNHNLNRQNVMVQTYDSSYNQIIPQNIQLTSINTAVITFPTNTSGYAIASIGGVTGQAVSASYAFTSSFVLPLSQSVIISGSGNTTAFQVLTGSAIPAFMVSSSGNIGIGTSNPLEKLDVFGDIRLRTDATGLGPSLILNNGTEAAGNYSQIAFGGAQFPSSYLKGGIAYVTLASTNGRGDMYFLQNSAADGTNATLANAVMVISNSGSVSIGKTAPNARLDVSGSVLISGSLTTTGTITAQTLVVQTITSSTDFVTGSTRFGSLSTNTHQFTGSVLISGSLGIGTAPSFPLEISSTSTTLLARFTSNQNEAQIRLVNTSAGGRTYSLGSGGTSSGGARGFYIYDETAGTAVLAISGSGNIGIGTTSPNDLLEVRGGFIRLSATSGNGPQFNLYSNGQTNNHITLAQGFALATDNIGYLYNRANAAFVFGTNNTERMRISSEGTMGFNSSIISSRSYSFKAISGSPIAIEAIESAGVHSMFFRPNNSGYNLISSNYLSGGTYLPLSLSGRENTSDFILTNTGDVLVGTTSSPSAYGKVSIRGTNQGLTIQDAATNGYRAIYSQSGNLYFYNGTNEGYLSTAGTWVNASDSTIKKDVKDIEYGLNEVMKLKPKWYKMIEDNLEQIGFIAQDVEEVLPELVSTSEKGMKGLSYGQLTAVLTKAIQEQQAIITSLQARIEQLENK